MNVHKDACTRLKFFVEMGVGAPRQTFRLGRTPMSVRTPLNRDVERGTLVVPI